MATKITALLDQQAAKADPLQRLAAIIKLVQLHDHGRLPLEVMRILDDIDLDDQHATAAER
jgi:hypothetical protein